MFFDNLVDYAGGAGTPREWFVYSYDTQDRETQAIQHLADGTVRVVDKSYDSEGRLTRIVSPEGAINYRYDTFDRLASISTGDTANPEDETRYTYDALHRLKAVTAVKRNGTTLSPPAKTSYKYDAVGNLDRTDQANGVIVDYIYDNLYRLDQLIHFSPDATPSDLSNNSKLASFDYGYRADGQRTSENGFIAGYGPANYQWDYDALGRLTKETFTSSAAAQNFTAKYEFDLSSNRVRKTVDKFNNSTIDEVLTSLYDSNDRQLSETSSLGKVTLFTYNQTQQATKTVKQAGVTQETMSMQYNLQGMLDTAIVNDYTSDALSRSEKTSYRYSTEGARVASKHEIDSNVDSIFESFTNTQKLTDSLNPTGFSQVLQETTTDQLGNVVKSIDYTLGFDQISQTVVTSSNPIPVTHYFQTDGHGSTRLLTTPAGSIVNNGTQNELYHYDAYGLPINFDSSTALTSYLKDSEPLDVHTNLIHLRARDYNYSQGVFTTLDGYSGNHLDPLSFNKYQFVHANPVLGVDPSGRSFIASFNLGSLYGLALSTGRNVATVNIAITALSTLAHGGVYYLNDKPVTQGLIYGAKVGLILSQLNAYARTMKKDQFVQYTGKLLSEGIFGAVSGAIFNSGILTQAANLPAGKQFDWSKTDIGFATYEGFVNAVWGYSFGDWLDGYGLKNSPLQALAVQITESVTSTAILETENYFTGNKTFAQATRDGVFRIIEGVIYSKSFDVLLSEKLANQHARSVVKNLFIQIYKAEIASIAETLFGPSISRRN
jgi:RHS repeat-associated protein